MDRISPRKTAHIVYRTRRYDEMIAWYQAVFGAEVLLRDDVLTFLTYDDEHHRFALVNLDVLDPDGAPAGDGDLVGVDHVGYTFASLDELLDHYTQLRSEGIAPYWCIHHGVTVSMYYADPDGNQMEFQVECFTSPEENLAFMRGPGMASNPIGVEFDPADLFALREQGRLDEFLRREVHEPMSPIRGVLGRV